MSHAAQRVKAIIQGLAQDSQHYRTLRTLLDQQRLHIIARDAAELDAVNARIMTLYQQLSHSSQQRYQWLDALGIQASNYGMQSLISRLPVTHKPQVSALWHDLQQQAAACRTQNEANGALMHMQQEILTSLLNIGEPENWLYQQV
jgi:flagellar biosynthesis protein FlgN